MRRGAQRLSFFTIDFERGWGAVRAAENTAPESRYAQHNSSENKRQTRPSGNKYHSALVLNCVIAFIYRSV